MERDALH
jgi:hypothetical protein